MSAFDYWILSAKRFLAGQLEIGELIRTIEALPPSDELTSERLMSLGCLILIALRVHLSGEKTLVLSLQARLSLADGHNLAESFMEM